MRTNLNKIYIFLALIKDLTIMQSHGDNFYASELLVAGDYTPSEVDLNLSNITGNLTMANTKQGYYNMRNTTVLVQNPFFTLISSENPNSIDFVFSTVVLADNNVWAGFAFSYDNKMVSRSVWEKVYSQKK